MESGKKVVLLLSIFWKIPNKPYAERSSNRPSIYQHLKDESMFLYLSLSVEGNRVHESLPDNAFQWFASTETLLSCRSRGNRHSLTLQISVPSGLCDMK